MFIFLPINLGSNEPECVETDTHTHTHTHSLSLSPPRAYIISLFLGGLNLIICIIHTGYLNNLIYY